MSEYVVDTIRALELVHAATLSDREEIVNASRTVLSALIFHLKYPQAMMHPASRAAYDLLEQTYGPMIRRAAK